MNLKPKSIQELHFNEYEDTNESFSYNSYAQKCKSYLDDARRRLSKSKSYTKLNLCLAFINTRDARKFIKTVLYKKYSINKLRLVISTDFSCFEFPALFHNLEVLVVNFSKHHNTTRQYPIIRKNIDSIFDRLINLRQLSLTLIFFTHEQAIAFAAFICDSKLERLHLAQCKIIDKESTEANHLLFRAINKSNLEIVDYEFITSTESGSNSIVPNLIPDSKLTSLSLKLNKATTTFIGFVADFINQIKCLEHLEILFDSHQISIMHLIDVLRDNRYIYHLTIHCEAIWIDNFNQSHADDVCHSIATVITHNKCIRRLEYHVHGTKAGDVGFIIDAFKSNNFIEYLHLENLRNADCVKIASLLEYNQALTNLIVRFPTELDRIKGKEILGSNIKILLGGLCHNQSLKYLDICVFQPDEKTFLQQKLLSPLMQNQTLKHLSIFIMWITGDFREENLGLCEVLRHTKSLQSIKVDTHNFTNQEWLDIFKALRYNNSVKRMHFDLFCLSNLVYQKFGKLLQYNRALTDITINCDKSFDDALLSLQYNSCVRNIIIPDSPIHYYHPHYNHKINLDEAMKHNQCLESIYFFDAYLNKRSMAVNLCSPEVWAQMKINRERRLNLRRLTLLTAELFVKTHSKLPELDLLPESVILLLRKAYNELHEIRNHK